MFTFESSYVFFSEIASPFRRLTGKGVDQDWNSLFWESFKEIKQEAGGCISVKGIYYLEEAGALKLAGDSSLEAAGVVLMQVDPEGQDRPILYKSLTFMPTGSWYLSHSSNCVGLQRS